MLRGLYDSIWQPGVNKTLMASIHAIFLSLFITNVAVWAILRSWAVFAMIIMSVLMYLTLLWFIKEAQLEDLAERKLANNKIE
jgi:hypothetical protein